MAVILPYRWAKLHRRNRKGVIAYVAIQDEGGSGTGESRNGI